LQGRFDMTFPIAAARLSLDDELIAPRIAEALETVAVEVRSAHDVAGLNRGRRAEIAVSALQEELDKAGVKFKMYRGIIARGGCAAQIAALRELVDAAPTRKRIADITEKRGEEDADFDSADEDIASRSVG
jgi:cell division ATPase FtsA